MEFEEATGIAFDHIRLLARAFTVRNVGFTSLTRYAHACDVSYVNII